MAESQETVTLREIRQGDRGSLLRLYTQLHGNSMPEESPALDALWQRILQDEGYHVIVAVKGEAVVSSCVVAIIPNLTHGQRPYAVVENVITDEACRGRGLATACLDYAKRLAERENCYKMMLLTGSKQESTLRFYERAGYNRVDKTGYIQWLNP